MQLVIALLLCAATLVGYSAWYTAIADKSSAVATLENQIQTKAETEGRIVSARAALAEIAGDEASLQGYFVPETGIVAFIDDLEARGRAQNAVVNVLSVSTDTVGGHAALAFTVSIKGTFDAVMRTLGSIEYAPRDLSISTLALSLDEKNNWRADLKLVVGSVAPPAKNSP